MKDNLKISIIFNRRKTATKESDSAPRKGSVEIQVNRDGRRKYLSTGVSVYLNQWKNGAVVGRNSVDLNQQIYKAYEKAKIAGSGRVGVDAVCDETLGRIDFCDWMEQQVRERTDLADATRVHHERTVRWLREFGLIRTFSDLTERNIVLWDQFIKKRLTHQASIYNYHKRLKPYIRIAMQLGYIDESPYRFFKTPNGKSESIKYLTEAERDAIEALPLDGTLADVRDMFIFSCYTGLAFCDLVRVKDSLVREGDQWFIDGQRLKTSVRYHLRVLPKALEILKRHDFNLDLISNQKANLYLKTIASAAGVKKNLTMHMGRHTFATWALKSGVSLPVVSKMLAHTNIATTQIYAKVLQSEVERGFDILDGAVQD